MDMFELFRKRNNVGQEGPAMFKGFFEYFSGDLALEVSEGDPYEVLIGELGGRSFGNGIFKVFSREELAKWDRIVGSCYTALHGNFRLFGYDWMGRCFALDENRPHAGEVILLEIGTMKALYIERGLLDFLNDEIPHRADACLAAEFYADWLASHAPVGPMECAGYRIPLFLGGEDSLENMEISDMEVYWDMTDQLWEAVKDLPEGTKIGNVTFE